MPTLRDKGEKTAFSQYIERVFYGTGETEEDAKTAKIVMGIQGIRRKDGSGTKLLVRLL